MHHLCTTTPMLIGAVGCDTVSYNRLIDKLVERLRSGMEGYRETLTALQSRGPGERSSASNQVVSDQERGAVSSSVPAAVSWNEQDDKALLEAVSASIGQNTPGSETAWDAISAKIDGKSSLQCLLRYLSLSGATIPPPPLTKHQDPGPTQPVARRHTPQSDNDTISTHEDSYQSSTVSSVEPAMKKRKRTNEGDSAWTDEERSLLQKLVEQYRDRSPRWNEIAANFDSKHSAVDCLSQWQSITNSPVIKGKGSWTPEEDHILRSKRQELGRKWSQIAKFLPGRQGKQCRERYVNHLNPELKKGEWTDAEEAVLISCHQQFGNRWASISKQLPGRSDNDVKNHWYSTIQRKFAQHGKDNLVEAAVQQFQFMKSTGSAPAQKQAGQLPWPTTSSYEPTPMIPEAPQHGSDTGGTYAPLPPPQHHPMPYYHGHAAYYGQGPPPPPPQPHHQFSHQQQQPLPHHMPHQHHPYNMYPPFYSHFPESRDRDDEGEGDDDSDDGDDEDDQKVSATHPSTQPR